MRESKDTPLHAPIRVWTPNLLANFSWTTILGWYLATALATSFEPDPSGMNIDFRWTYILQGQLLGLGIRLLLPLALLPFRPRLTIPALLRLSLGACLVWLWTSPLAWAWHTPMGGIVLAVVRELAWVVVVLVGSQVERPSSHRSLGWTIGLSLLAIAVICYGLSLYTSLWLLGLFTVLTIMIGVIPRRYVWGFLGAGLAVAASIAIQTIPDLVQANGIQMDNVRSGRIVTGTPSLPPGFVLKARWTLQGPDDLLEPERLSLGARQIVRAAGHGTLVVDVAPGTVPPPQDTSESAVPSRSEGELLDRLLADIAPGSSDSLKLLQLHARVHASIRYDRTYFPGNCDVILKRGTGDCKAFAHLMTEGARRLGFRAREVHGLLASPDGYYAHAWTTIELGGRWTDWDPTSSTPFPDARYLRFSIPERASGAFDGELAIFTLRRIEFQALETLP